MKHRNAIAKLVAAVYPKSSVVLFRRRKEKSAILLTVFGLTLLIEKTGDLTCLSVCDHIKTICAAYFNFAANTCACVGFYLYILASKASGMWIKIDGFLMFCPKCIVSESLDFAFNTELLYWHESQQLPACSCKWWHCQRQRNFLATQWLFLYPCPPLVFDF